MQQVKNIIFDLGGVLLDIDYNKTSAAFIDLGFDDFDRMYSQATADKLFEQLETGHISNDDFLQKIIAMAPGKVTEQQVLDAWNAMLLNFRQESLDFLETLAQRCNIYLLSNTNAIHIESFERLLEHKTGKPTLDGYFTKAWYSHKIGKRKPYKETYAWVLADGNLDPAETLFIDDSVNNMAGADEVGMHTHLLQPHERIETIGL